MFYIRWFYNAIFLSTMILWYSLEKHATVNSLWSSYNATWWHKSRSTLTQAMACCLTAPSHYLNQCWLFMSEVQWHSSQGTFIIDTTPSCVICCWPEQTVEQTVELEAIQDSTTFMWHHCDGEQVMITMKLITSVPAYLAVKSQNPNMDKWCGMKLVIHSQTHTVASLKFENG